MKIDLKFFALSFTALVLLDSNLIFAKSKFFSHLGIEDKIDLGKSGVSLNAGTGLTNLNDLSSGITANYGKDDLKAKVNFSKFKSLKAKKKK